MEVGLRTPACSFRCWSSGDIYILPVPRSGIVSTHFGRPKTSSSWQRIASINYWIWRPTYLLVREVFSRSPHPYGEIQPSNLYQPWTPYLPRTNPSNEIHHLQVLQSKQLPLSIGAGNIGFSNSQPPFDLRCNGTPFKCVLQSQRWRLLLMWLLRVQPFRHCNWRRANLYG